MVMEDDEGSQKAGEGYSGKFCIASGWVGEDLGLGLWFVLFCSY